MRSGARSASARFSRSARTARSRCAAASCSRTNDRVLVVEDVFTTGGSTRETMQVATAAGGQVVGAASIVDRSGGRLTFEVPYHSLLEIALPTDEPDKCPLCAQGLPV